MHDEIQHIVPVSLDAETNELLVRFARACNEHPTKIAAALLRDLLIEDAAAHRSFN